MNFNQNDYPKFSAAIRQAELRYQLPPDLLAGVLFQASQYDPDRIAGKDYNPRGVIGIAKLSREDCDFLWQGVDHRADPARAILGAARLLRDHYRRFNNWRDAVAAYHTCAQIVADHHHGRAPMPIDTARYMGEIATVARI